MFDDPLTRLLARHGDWLEEQMNIDPEEYMVVEDESNNGSGAEELKQAMGKRSSSVSTLSGIHEPMDLDRLVDAVMSYRHAVGEYRGYPVAVDVSYVGSPDENKWVVTTKIIRRIVENNNEALRELSDVDYEGLETMTSEITKTGDTEHDNVVQAYKVFEDTVEEYGLIEVTDPELPETERLDHSVVEDSNDE